MSQNDFITPEFLIKMIFSLQLMIMIRECVGLLQPISIQVRDMDSLDQGTFACDDCDIC